MSNKNIEFNRLFAFFLDKKGVVPKFRKTKYGYRTFDNTWKLFEDTLSITHIKPAKVYNGYDYDDGLEETKYEIKKHLEKISIEFVYTKLFWDKRESLMAKIDRIKEEVNTIRGYMFYALGFIAMFMTGLGVVFIKIIETTSEKHVELGMLIFSIVALLFFMILSAIIYFKNKHQYDIKLTELEEEN